MDDTPNPITPYNKAPPDVGRPQGTGDPSFEIQARKNTALGPKLAQMRPKEVRRLAVRLSAIVCILVPTILAMIYYIFIAANQYAVEVRFSVRSASATPSVDVLSAVTGMPSAGSTVTDSYIVMDYIHSREILDKLIPRLDVRKIYNHPDADYLASFNPSNTIEEFLEYWKSMIAVNFDSTSQIISVEARAFTAEDSKKVATMIVTLSEELINDLSVRARNDAVKFARAEVTRAEERLQKNRADIRKFRDKRQELDPVKKAEAQQTLLGKLEGELLAAQARLLTVSPDMAKDAPTIIFLNRQINALSQQVIAERAKIAKRDPKATGGNVALSGLLSDFEELSIEREFSQKIYASAIVSLETARADANRQQKYLATFVKPRLPEEALYPQRVLNILIVFFISTVLWALGIMVVYAIRDHA